MVENLPNTRLFTKKDTFPKLEEALKRDFLKFEKH